MEIKHFKLSHSEAPELNRAQIDAANADKMRTLNERMAIDGDDRDDPENWW